MGAKITALAIQDHVGLSTGDVLVTVDISDTTMAASGTDKQITAGELALAFSSILGLGSAATHPASDFATSSTLASAQAYTDAAINALLTGSDDLGTALSLAASTYRASLGLGAAALLGATDVIRFVVDGSSTLITTGAKKAYITVAWNCVIQSWKIMGDGATGTVRFDIWRTQGFPPTVTNTITASAKPEMATATKASSSVLTGWQSSLVVGDVLEINIDACVTTTKTELELTVLRST